MDKTTSATSWRPRPIIYEIHTFPWLSDLSARSRRPLTLAEVPASEWDAIAALGADAVWLMGVWERSPAGIAVSNANAELQNDFRRALPDYTTADNIGSAYCIRDYTVDARLGGAEGLAAARAQLAQRGLKLVLDFVPNHVAPDHPWTAEHAEYFVRGTPEDLERAPTEFLQVGESIIANGRDPYFPPWPDVVQLNAFDAGLRAAAIATVKSIAAQCDGMRCDMAMLMLNEIFARTWGERAGATPPTEYWTEVINAVKAALPDTVFIAEAYWDLEYALQQLGFDYCYDKRLYDRLEHQSGEAVQGHLRAGLDYQDKLLRFVENHDEPRAAATFQPMQERAYAVAVMTLPGAKLVYEGQLEGRKIRPPVFLGRRAAEPRNYELETFMGALLKRVRTDLFHLGEWTLCERQGWTDNASYQNVLGWTWQYEDARAVVVVNIAGQRSQALVRLPWTDLTGRALRFEDVLNGDVFIREGAQLQNSGLFVDLDAFRFHFFFVE